MKIRAAVIFISGALHMDYYVYFDDVHDAARAIDQAKWINVFAPHVMGCFTVSHVCASEFAHVQREVERVSGFPTGESAMACETEVTCSVYFDDQAPSAENVGNTPETTAYQLLQSNGDLINFYASGVTPDGAQHYGGRFAKVSAASAVIGKLTKESPFPGNVSQFDRHATLGRELTSSQGWQMWFGPQQGGTTSPTKSDEHVIAITPQKTNAVENDATFTSPTGRTAWSVDAWGNTIPIKANTQDVEGVFHRELDVGQTQAARHLSEPSPKTPSYLQVGQTGPRNNSWAGPVALNTPTSVVAGTPGTPQFEGPQNVDVEKIRGGYDVRTTIMLRNLPNKMNYHKLREILNTYNFGEYDFSYLRIDFRNNSNVGYGFVNFIDPDHIVKFYDAWVGKPWVPSLPHDPRAGPRIAEVSYATVQGKDCLIERFRNSSVMCECPDYRPKTWYTAETAPCAGLIGEEMPFPGVNNPSKHQRSRDNAGQIGLYPPQSRRGRTNGERMHRSQYDRGTPAQLYEEAMHHQNQQASPMHAFFPRVSGGHHPSGMSFNMPFSMPFNTAPPPFMPQMPNNPGAPYARGSTQHYDPFQSNFMPMRNHGGPVQGGPSGPGQNNRFFGGNQQHNAMHYPGQHDQGPGGQTFNGHNGNNGHAGASGTHHHHTWHHNTGGHFANGNGQPSSNSHSSNNGHSANGNGQSPSNGHSSNNGHSANGNGQSPSNGHSSNNGGHFANGNGQSSSNGHSSNNGHSANTNGQSSSNGHHSNNGHVDKDGEGSRSPRS